MPNLQITAPTEEPVTLAQVKAHLRVDGDAEDALIGLYLQAARGAVETMTSRALVTQVWEYVADRLPPHGFALPLGPVAAVESIVVRQPDGSVRTLDPDEYSVSTVPARAWISAGSGLAWPPLADRPDAVAVRYTAGTAVAAVLAELKSAVLLMAAHLYQQREPVAIGTIAETLPFSVEALCMPFKIWGF